MAHDVHGSCSDRFAAVRAAFEKNFDDGKEVGASVAIVKDGEMVVDLWAGYTDETESQPWTRDTITNVWSITKTMAALVALVLADRGELDLHAPVATYWPEFAVNGKEDVLVCHVLGHTSGVSGWEQPLTQDDMWDWQRCADLLAAQAPWWKPGSASGYHALNQGHMTGEVVRRITGMTLGTFFAKEIAGPLAADFHIGLPPEADSRVSNVIPPPPMAIGGIDPNGIAMKTFANPGLSAEAAWTEGWRRAEIPAANGHGNARSVAQIQSIVSHGGEANGLRLLSEKGCEAIFEEQARGVDQVLGVPLWLGTGYGLVGEETPLSPNARSCFWGGWGGSLVVNDLDERMTVAYVMNRMGEGTVGDDRGAGILFAAYGAVADA